MLLSMILDYQYLSSGMRNYAHGRDDHARTFCMVSRALAWVSRPIVSHIDVYCVYCIIPARRNAEIGFKLGLISSSSFT